MVLYWLVGLGCPHARGGDRKCSLSSTGSSRCPHARGGEPMPVDEKGEMLALSPRTWGRTDLLDAAPMEFPVVPTHVGVNRL